MAGTVYLVGAGPGDPGLLTRRGAALLRRAEVVVYDALIDRSLLDLAGGRAERIDVGKRGGRAAPSQEAINNILVDAASRAGVVVRLKGGDPFVFGRGGEEALALRRAGVRIEVVPGVTAALGAAACAGIPLTHRGVSSSLTLVTGTTEGGAANDSPSDTGTQVFYMAVSHLPSLTRRLIDSGVPAMTPAAAVQWATRPEQRVVEGTLADLAERVCEAGLGSPAVIVVGDVVALRSEIDWWHDLPLRGRRVVVARARAQVSRLARMLADAGAEVIEFPSFEVSAPSSRKAVAEAVRTLDRFDGVVFTSVAGVKGFLAGIEQAGLDARALSGQRLFAFGRSTIERLARHGLRADVSLSSYDTARAVAACGGRTRLRGRRLLFLTRDGVRSPLREALEGAGAAVEQVGAYGQVLRAEGVEALRHALDEGSVDVVVFPSSSSVEGWVKALGNAHHGRAVVAAIGPATAGVLASHGTRAGIVASGPSIEALVGDLVERFGHEAHANTRRDHGRHPGTAARRARLSAKP